MVGSGPAFAIIGLAVVLSAGGDARAAESDTYDLRANAAIEIGGNPPFWSASVGTGTASLALRGDLQTQFKIAHRELGMQRVRGHGVLNDLDIYAGSGEAHDWTRFDTYLDAIVSAGMRPIMELSFMPPPLARGGRNPIFAPPQRMDDYAAFVHDVIQHCVDKYGLADVSQWYWEVWNEPDYVGFWTGSLDEYYALYAATVRSATAVIPDILIGGPAATEPRKIKGFLQYCKSHNLRVTFVSSHSYPGGAGSAVVNAADLTKDNDTRLGQIESGGYTRASVKSFNTEWSSSHAGQGGGQSDALLSMDNHWNAGFILKSVKLLSDKNVGDTPPVDVFSYWALSDIFDEWGGFGKGDGRSYIATQGGQLPFGRVFGLMTYQGVRKASFNAFKMLSHLGPRRLWATGGTRGDGVDLMVTLSATGDELQILVYDSFKKLNTGGVDEVNVTVTNVPPSLAGKELFVTHFRVDESHSNPFAPWMNQGRPTHPTEADWRQMREAQHLALYEQVAKTSVDTTFTTRLSLPRQGASLILLGLNRPLIGRNALVEMEAEDYDAQSGMAKEQDSRDVGLGQSVVGGAGAFLAFDQVDFADAGASSARLRVSADEPLTLELRASSLEGPLLGRCAVPSTQGTWTTQVCPLRNIPRGVGALYVVWGGRARLNWLVFEKTDANAAPEESDQIRGRVNLGWGRVVSHAPAFSLLAVTEPSGCACRAGGQTPADSFWVAGLVAAMLGSRATTTGPKKRDKNATGGTKERAGVPKDAAA